MVTDGKKIGKLIEAERERQGYTMQDIADKFNTSRQNIKRYENWNLKKPDIELLEGIFDFLGLDKSVLKKSTTPIKSANTAPELEALKAENAQLKEENNKMKEELFQALRKLINK